MYPVPNKLVFGNTHVQKDVLGSGSPCVSRLKFGSLSSGHDVIPLHPYIQN